MIRNYNFDDLTPGSLFQYRGPRRLLERTWAFAQILGLEPDRAIVHLSTFFEEREDDRFSVAISHIPIVFSAFRKSAPTILALKPIFPEALARVERWRNRSSQGEVGAFTVEIYKVEKMIWRIIREQDPDASLERTFVETAYPRRGPNGRMDVVEVAARSRS